MRTIRYQHDHTSRYGRSPSPYCPAPVEHFCWLPNSPVLLIVMVTSYVCAAFLSAVFRTTFEMLVCTLSTCHPQTFKSYRNCFPCSDVSTCTRHRMPTSSFSSVYSLFTYCSCTHVQRACKDIRASFQMSVQFSKYYVTLCRILTLVMGLVTL